MGMCFSFFSPKKHNKICSRHFSPQMVPSKNDSGYPTLFSHNNFGMPINPRTTQNSDSCSSKGQSSKQEECKDDLQTTEQANSKGNQEECKDDLQTSEQTHCEGTFVYHIDTLQSLRIGKEETVPNQQIENDHTSLKEQMIPTPDDHTYTYACNEKPDCPQTSDQFTQTDMGTDDIEQMIIKINQLEKPKVESITILDSFKKKVLNTDHSVKRYTGIPNLLFLYGLFNIIEPYCASIKYWNGKQSANQMQYETNKEIKPGKKRKLSFFEEYLLTLIRIKQNFDVEILADLFGIDKAGVSRIFTTWINVLFRFSSIFIVCPPQEQIKKYSPNSFKKDFPNVTMIIDCTEFYIQRPGNPDAQCKTYSSYKSHNTFKLLVGVTPSGAFTFLSRLYGGNASDRFIVEESEFLGLIENGMEVMADRGFSIRDLLTLKKATLWIPAFTRPCKYGKNKRLNVKEIKQTSTIAKHRIHVERAIERIKRFKILSNTIPLTLKPVINQIISVAGFICNMHNPIVKN